MPTSSSGAAVSVGVYAPVEVSVVAGAGRGEAEGAGLDALAGEFGHQRDVVGGGVLVVRAALAHHVQPQRAVRHLGADVDVVRPLVDGVEELGERLPVPRQALVERGAGDVLDAFHQLDELAVVAVGTGAKPTPQLPITTVVTPCHDEGCSRLSHVAWPS